VELSTAAIELRSRLAQLRENREKLESRVADLKRKEATVIAQLQSLEVLIRELDPASAGRAFRWATEDEQWQLKTRQGAVFEALRDHLGTQAHINDIANFLQGKGRDDSYHLVSAALAGLARQELVEQGQQRGVWKIAKPKRKASG